MSDMQVCAHSTFAFADAAQPRSGTGEQRPLTLTVPDVAPKSWLRVKAAWCVSEECVGKGILMPPPGVHAGTRHSVLAEQAHALVPPCVVQRLKAEVNVQPMQPGKL